jgi:excisionase family DNA binding protein
MEGNLVVWWVAKMEELLTEEEVAEKLHISRRRLQALCRDGGIEFVRVTPRVRGFLPEHVEEFIRRKTVTPPKVVDRSVDKSLPFAPRGGENRKSAGDSLSERKKLREELRSWR